MIRQTTSADRKAILEKHMAMVVRKAKSPEDIIAALLRTPIDAHNMHMLVVGGEMSELIKGRRKFMFLSPEVEGYDMAVKSYVLDLGDVYWYLGGVRYGYNLGPAEWEGEWHEEFLAYLHSDDEQMTLEELEVQLGDVIDAGKRIAIYRKGRDPKDGSPEARARAWDELKVQTDRLLYAVTACERLLEQLGSLRGYTREMVVDMNFEKLGERYVDGYSDQQAQDRADEKDGHDLSTVPANVPAESNPWGFYKRKGLSEMRPYVEGEELEGKVSISEADKLAGSPKVGDMIARNPSNHFDQWLVAAAYFADNLEPA